MASPSTQPSHLDSLPPQYKELLLQFALDLSGIQTRKTLSDRVRESFIILGYYSDIIITVGHGEYKVLAHFITENSKDEHNYLLSESPDATESEGLIGLLKRTDNPYYFTVQDLANYKGDIQFIQKKGFDYFIRFKLHCKNLAIGDLLLQSDTAQKLTAQQTILFTEMSELITQSAITIRAHEEIENKIEQIERYKSNLEQANLHLKEQIKTSHSHSEIIGSGDKIKKVFDLINMVAPTDSTVLLSGETGTGKELVARAIHNASNQKNKIMIKVNCAALPASLIESELFGHEKGSFTGASELRIGKFELAHNSTLFLDEIGEMPIDSQVKLLRAIQEKEIERIGGKEAIKVNVRIIAATNRNLLQEVELGRFRKDLFYRLEVFPIVLPPLRERLEDIPMLTLHFMDRFAVRTGHRLNKVSKKSLEILTNYTWPGNIRELEHVIERSVLMADGTMIKDIYLPVAFEKSSPSHADPQKIKSFNDIERDHLLEILNKCKWKISGKNSAASLLNIPATTLHSKMKKLGISRNRPSS